MSEWPKYRYLILDGVCRQDVPGGRWVQLSLEETDTLLARFDGLTVKTKDKINPEPIFHHQV